MVWIRRQACVGLTAAPGGGAHPPPIPKAATERNKTMSKWICTATYTVDVPGCDLSRECTALIGAEDILPDEEVERILREGNPRRT